MADYKDSSLPLDGTPASLSRTDTQPPTMNDAKHLTPTLSPDTESLHDAKKNVFMANTLAQDAQEATTKEQNMTLKEGLRMYPKAIMWSVIISTCIAMEGYDLCLLGNFCE
jgi:SP family general alpha glucoside:H+ symporter-like MFS transporter